MIKNLSHLISGEIRTNNIKNPWLPTPQDILNGTSMENTNICYPVGWIIDPKPPFSNDGLVKPSKVKLIKVMKICDGIGVHIPTLRQTLGKVLLSLDTYHKTGSSTFSDDLHKLRHSIHKPFSLRINGQNGAPINLQLYL